MDKNLLERLIRLTVADVFSNLEKTTVTEGGAVFPSCNSAVPREMLDSTIRNALEMSGLYNLDYEIVGNKSKPFCGDVDIAIDSKQLTDEMELERPESFWQALDDFLKYSDVNKYKVNKGLQQIHLLAPLVGQSGDKANAVDDKGEEFPLPGLVQIDVFIGNLGWMKDLTSGAPAESRYKAVYRNLLLSSIAREVKWDVPGENPDEYYRYSINFRDGLKKNRYKMVPPTGRQRKPQRITMESDLISTDPNELASILFGKGVKWSDIESFEKLYAQLHEPWV